MTIQLPKIHFSSSIEIHLRATESTTQVVSSVGGLCHEITSREQQIQKRLSNSYKMIRALNAVDLNNFDTLSENPEVFHLPASVYTKLDAKVYDPKQRGVILYLLGVHAAFKELSPDIERCNLSRNNKVKRMESKIIATIAEIYKKNQPVRMISEITKSLFQRMQGSLEVAVLGFDSRDISFEKAHFLQTKNS
jgi:hypothetical protein